jgi:hypothetical protein
LHSGTLCTQPTELKVQPSNAVGKFFPFTIVYLAQAVLELMCRFCLWPAAWLGDGVRRRVRKSDVSLL